MTKVIVKIYTNTYKPEENKDTCKKDCIFELEEKEGQTKHEILKKKNYE
jgi:hypothetical protein